MSSRSPSNNRSQASILVAQAHLVVAPMCRFLPVCAVVELLEDGGVPLCLANFDVELSHMFAGVMAIRAIGAGAINCLGGRVVNG